MAEPRPRIPHRPEPLSAFRRPTRSGAISQATPDCPAPYQTDRRPGRGRRVSLPLRRVREGGSATPPRLLQVIGHTLRNENTPRIPATPLRAAPVPIPAPAILVRPLASVHTGKRVRCECPSAPELLDASEAPRRSQARTAPAQPRYDERPTQSHHQSVT